MSISYPNTRSQKLKLQQQSLPTLSEQNSAVNMTTETFTGADLQAVLKTISDTQLEGFKSVQHTANKNPETQLTKVAQTISEAKTDSSNTPSRGIPKPEPFSGQITDDFTVWLQHFRSIATLHKWSHEVCAERLHTYLTGAALTFFQSLPADKRANFEATVTTLCAHFDDSTIRTSLHIQLHNRKQNLNETVTDFCNDIEKRFLRLGVSQELYKLLVFLDGLQPHLQFEVRKTGPSTYNQAKELGPVSGFKTFHAKSS